IYADPQPPPRLQRRLDDQVARIVCTHQPAPEPIRIPARAGVEETQVSGGPPEAAAEDGGPADGPRCRAHAIRLPAPSARGPADPVRAVAAYKRPSEADSANWVVGVYFLSAWRPADTPRSPLPVALDLASLYGQLLRRLMPYPPREGESLKDHAERLDRVRSL